MSVRLCGLQKADTAATSGAVTANVVAYDLASLLAETGQAALNNACVYAEGLLLGRTGAGNCCKLALTRTFSILSGALTGVAISELVSNVTSAALAGVTADLVISGTEIRLTPTGVIAQDITWVGYLTLWSTLG